MKMSSAFSLTELLVVIVIIAILAVASLPMISSLNQAGGMNAASGTILSLLQQSHLYATSHNTYVYVGVLSTNTSASTTELWLVGAASRTGTDLSQGGTHNINVNDPNGGLELLGKVAKFPRILIKTGSQISSALVSRPAGALSLNLQTATSTLSPIFQATFSNFVWFCPDGTASSNATGANSFEFGIEAAQQQKNAAVFQVTGITGIAKLYRP